MRTYVYFVSLEWLSSVHLSVSAALVFESRTQGQLTCAPPHPLLQAAPPFTVQRRVVDEFRLGTSLSAFEIWLCHLAAV